MKLLYDFFPIILFFIAYKTSGIYIATAIAIGASCIQVSFSWLKHRRVEKMQLISFLLLSVFGGLTLLLQDSTFIKWKPTVLNWLFAAIFFGSQLLGKKTVIERMMGHQISLQANIWLKLNLSWVFFFLLCGAANLYVAYHFSEETWVNFKLFGLLGLTFLFGIAQAFYLSKYIGKE